MTMSRSAVLLSGLLGGSSVLHLVTPKFFDAMVPKQSPGEANTWTRVSAAAEFAVAGLVAVPRTRRIGGLAAAGLFVAVFPANLQMTADAFRRDRPTREKVVSIVRLPLQVPLVAWGLAVGRSART